MVSIFTILAMILVLLVYLVMNRRWARKSKPMLFVTRATACILVQLIAILAATSVITQHDEPIEPVDREIEAKKNSAETLIIVAIITIDAIIVAVIALYKSSWVEPLLR